MASVHFLLPEITTPGPHSHPHMTVQPNPDRSQALHRVRMTWGNTAEVTPLFPLSPSAVPVTVDSQCPGSWLVLPDLEHTLLAWVAQAPALQTVLLTEQLPPEQCSFSGEWPSLAQMEAL